MEERGYEKDVTGGDEEEGKPYLYLLEMNFRSITKKKMEELEKTIEKLSAELATLNSTTDKQLWLNDLSEFETAYSKWFSAMEKADAKAENRKKKDGKSGVKSGVKGTRKIKQ